MTDKPSAGRGDGTRRPGLKIGLLGGSFNPAHDGHRHISLLALKRLGLDQVWWLVSPQNPLKSAHGMAPLKERLAEAQAVANHPRVRVTDLEIRLGTRFTADTLTKLRRRFPGHRFVWLMGADNLIQIPAWRRWTDIFATVPVAVFNRPDYGYKALAGCAAARFGPYRVKRQAARDLASLPPPAWTFVWESDHPESATAIRGRAAWA